MSACPDVLLVCKDRTREQRGRPADAPDHTEPQGNAADSQTTGSGQEWSAIEADPLSVVRGRHRHVLVEQAHGTPSQGPAHQRDVADDLTLTQAVDPGLHRTEPAFAQHTNETNKPRQRGRTNNSCDVMRTGVAFLKGPPARSCFGRRW